MGLTHRIVGRYIQASSVMYHVTTRENAVNILLNGLKPAHGGFTTEYGDAVIHTYYDARKPAFLGVRPWGGSSAGVTLQVNIAGIPLAADIPSVVESAGLVYGEIVLRRVGGGEDDDYVSSPEAIKFLGPYAERSPFSDGGYIDVVSMEELARAGSAAAKAAIKLTGTAAVYEVVPPERISLKKRDREIEREVFVKRFERSQPKKLTMGDLDALGDDAMQVFRDLKKGLLTEDDVWPMIEAAKRR